MDIALHAKVVGDGFEGRIVGLVVNPAKYQVTHLVVVEASSSQRLLVPIQQLQAATEHVVRLMPEHEPVPLTEPLPASSVLVQHDARIKASDGALGQLWCISITPRTGHIVNVIAREGLLRRHHTVRLPESLLGQIEPNAIHLKADRESLNWLKRHRT